MSDQQNPRSSELRALYDNYRAGKIDRRQFIDRAALSALGIGGAAFLANAGGASAKPLGGFAFAQDATPASGAEAALGRPEVGTEGQQRGAGGRLRLIQWQAPSILSPHVAVGVKDFMGACPVVEPLMHYLPDATLTPNLVKEVPSVANGLLAEDLTSVTYNLLEGVTWSDGEPFTADDVVFTWQWVMDEANASVNVGSFLPIENVEAVDDITVTVTFKAPNPNWFEAHAGTSTGFVYPRHIVEPEGGHDAFILSPTGTGPYVVTSFTPNDQVIYAPNENYREPNKPFFSEVLLKGGGDAASAARAVIQTGEYDFAWNLQVEPAVIEEMMSGDNTHGVSKVTPGANVERIDFNFSDPNTEVEGQRSQLGTPHPFLTDPAVREAINTAVNRQLIADEFYGEGNPAANNILSGIPALESPNTSFTYDADAARQLLEDAGWTGDSPRSKDGVELKVTYATSVNQVRQKTQAVVKDNLEDIGFEVTLEQVDAAIYFDSSAGNEQNINHFYWDFQMYQQVPSNPTPISYMESWYAGADNYNVAQKENDWSGQNYVRYVNADYDALLDASRTEPDPEKLADLFIQMNDLLINDHVMQPLVVVGSRTGIGERLREENLALGAFSYNYWNIANWNLADGFEPV